MFNKREQGRWWDFGWQLVEGCDKISPGCANCWSLAKEKRFRKETGVVFHSERLERPLHRKKPASFAIWNDLFHECVTFRQIEETFKVIRESFQHTFMILTKRPERVRDYWEWRQYVYLGRQVNSVWPDNAWIGVTAENQEQADKRIPILLQIPAKVRFVSVEPMLGKVDFRKVPEFNKVGLDLSGWWIIAGPETGPKARPMQIEWIQSIRDQCKSAGVPFFDKKNVLGLNQFEFPINL